MSKQSGYGFTCFLETPPGRVDTPEPLYITVCYSTVLDITLITVGSQLGYRVSAIRLYILLSLLHRLDS